MKAQDILPELLAYTAKKFKVSVEDIKSGKRDSEIIDAKRTFCYVAYTRFGSQIVAEYCFLDSHATVLSHNKKCKDLMQTEIEYNQKVVTIRNWFNKKMLATTFRPRITRQILPFV